MPKAKIPFGPTYDEMLNPSHQSKEVRKAAEKALKENELDPINLFNITWKNSKDGMPLKSSNAMTKCLSK